MHVLQFCNRLICFAFKLLVLRCTVFNSNCVGDAADDTRIQKKLDTSESAAQNAFVHFGFDF